ncbi:MAG: ABC transporter ATP-binding protein [Prevotellaceae bacterium]|jgi:lipoprotein-releasing system ATP-binding protein|nr:ABC transporter ATP-binding protein [Prevotellaceae bacterium]
MIRAEQLIKTYDSLQVLKGIDLEIRRSEVVTIVGASGAGKTTLLQILGTLGKPDAGQVYIGGVAVFDLNAKALADFRNRHIGFVFQFHHLLPEFTALENVCMPAFIAGKKYEQAAARAKELLDFLGLKDRMAHKPDELSGGEQQRVAVARALMNEPSVLLADEPSGNLDSKNKQELHRLFFTLRDQLHQTIVIVTHDPELAAMSDRTITMSDGKIR